MLQKISILKNAALLNFLIKKPEKCITVSKKIAAQLFSCIDNNK